MGEPMNASIPEDLVRKLTAKVEVVFQSHVPDKTGEEINADDLWGWADDIMEIAERIRLIGDDLSNAHSDAALRRGQNDTNGAPLLPLAVQAQREKGRDWVGTSNCDCVCGEFCDSCFPAPASPHHKAGPRGLVESLTDRF